MTRTIRASIRIYQSQRKSYPEKAGHYKIS